MNPIEALKFEAEMRGKKTYSPAEAKQNIARTLEGAARSMPILGNALSVRDIAEAKDEAQRFREQGFDQNADRQDRLALAAVPGAVLPAMSGAASAEGAASRAGVFVPAGEGPRSAIARHLRESGAANRDVWDKTRLFFGGDGSLRREISDIPMKVNAEKFRPGDISTLGEAIDHPELFAANPELAKSVVKWTREVDGRGAPIARTNPETGIMEVSLAGGDPRAGIAKLIQYQLADESRFPRSMRHGYDNIKRDLDEAQRLARDAGEPSQAQRYIDQVGYYQEALRQNAKTLGMTEAEKRTAARSAGNIDSRVVPVRANLPDLEKYPYGRGMAGGSNKASNKITGFDKMLVLPPNNPTREEMAKFLTEWGLYGSGKPGP